MSLIQKTVINKTYYTDGKKYYRYYAVSDPKIALTEFACNELGITKRSNFTPDELSRIGRLTGDKTRFELLKNGKPVPVPYKGGYPDVRQGDILLAPFKCPHCSSDTPPGTNCAVCSKPL